jgi:DNA-binding phage protein
MADNLKETGKPDDARINVEQEHELSYWSEKLGVSREQLRKAVQAAGPMVKDVQRHLNR